MKLQKHTKNSNTGSDAEADEHFCSLIQGNELQVFVLSLLLGSLGQELSTL